MIHTFVDSIATKSCAYLTVTLASAWTSYATQAHAFVSLFASLLSVLFCLLNLYTWFEGRRQLRINKIPKVIAISTNKLEKDDKKDES